MRLLGSCCALSPAISALVFAVGCAHPPYLVPAPSAQTAPGNSHVAVAEVSGVEIQADGEAWRSRPLHLEEVMTPIRVTIRNHSGHPLRIRYGDFRLTARASGFTAHALPPFKITGTAPSAPVAVVGPGFGYDDFLLAPEYGPYYPGYGVWQGPFDYDFPYYTTYFAQWPVSLPTKEMIRQAIPEGVLEGGGHLSGFLYFPKVPKENRDVQFGAGFRDARTRAPVVAFVIPFLLK